LAGHGLYPDSFDRRVPFSGQRIGYVRVSSFDQNPERQLDEVALNRTFTDKASGKDVQSPALEELIAFVLPGDTVVVGIDQARGKSRVHQGEPGLHG
jgi:hypothetical protein